MFYTINNTINFRDTDGLIWLDHDEASSIALTTTTSRLLAFLLERQGDVVSRDEILSHVWDAHGLRSSNNSLNKYISDLRNIFRNLGLNEEIIVTVPRIGFMLSADLPVEKHVLGERQQDVPVLVIENDPKKKRGATALFITAGLLVLVLFLIVKDSVFISKNSDEPLSQKTWSVGEVNGCRVFSFTPATPETIPIKLAIVKDMLDAEKMTCRPDGDVYFQAAEPVNYGSSGRVFLSICRNTDPARKSFSSCSSIYETAYEIKK
ncbi:DNA-binding winged helix-turn-helix (wHTH) protein [Enterobacter sp. BIGb0383]|uniref:winged helix-turn-helix domain-containing protein n=1 Tax=unclassified Enterobacter TaxID=2608935 RepID=UPI000F46E5C6|nr:MULTISPECIES: helix-turn-helix domain-containing protein [unclassified Enterobacter]ROP58348.1 DNA-binding winged helix-turn-helix (wHTH) protein [Enterobacter sp. BIGb0383]ROS06764.1 DNA-binding winged helix-turn-helix (wHTH) protein [Enterobacter sp. BIGb0359]